MFEMVAAKAVFTHTRLARFNNFGVVIFMGDFIINYGVRTYNIANIIWSTVSQNTWIIKNISKVRFKGQDVPSVFNNLVWRKYLLLKLKLLRVCGA